MTFPDTLAGSKAGSLIAVLNGTVSTSPNEFIEHNCTDGFKKAIPVNSRGVLLQQVKNMASPFELTSVELSDSFEISFVIRSLSKGEKFKISISLEQKSPNNISSMRIEPYIALPLASNSKISYSTDESQAIERIKTFLADQESLNRFSGSVLIAKNGDQLLLLSAGMSDKRFFAPNRIDTKFNLGSLNKLFTSVAILQIIKKGEISIDDPLGKFLTFFPKDISANVTVRHLLTMESGWGDYWNNEYYLQHKDELRTVSQYMQFIKDIPLDFEPGSSVQHSNIGFEVAGSIIEKVSGLDYFEYIREYIYKPAEMSNTDSYDRDGPVENLAIGYTNHHPCDSTGLSWRWENTYILSPRGTPAGGGYSTVEDILKFDNVFRSHKLLGSEYSNFMLNRFQGQIGDPLIQQNLSRSAGGAIGVSSFYARDIKNGYTVIVLLNIDNPVAIEIGNEILKLIGLL
ncbi:beta-lactamase family protein [candidate division WOR-3 bacterium]|nr:beta-lactamase family protein [candidate division WOR-3 bacterium]